MYAQLMLVSVTLRVPWSHWFNRARTRLPINSIFLCVRSVVWRGVSCRSPELHFIDSCVLRLSDWESIDLAVRVYGKGSSAREETSRPKTYGKARQSKRLRQIREHGEKSHVKVDKSMSVKDVKVAVSNASLWQGSQLTLLFSCKMTWIFQPSANDSSYAVKNYLTMRQLSEVSASSLMMFSSYAKKAKAAISLIHLIYLCNGTKDKALEELCLVEWVGLVVYNQLWVNAVTKPLYRICRAIAVKYDINE